MFEFVVKIKKKKLSLINLIVLANFIMTPYLTRN